MSVAQKLVEMHSEFVTCASFVEFIVLYKTWFIVSRLKDFSKRLWNIVQEHSAGT